MWWIQEQVPEGFVEVRHIENIWNVSDIGTKCLARLRLFFLMNRCNPVFAASGEEVGLEKLQRQSERENGSKNAQVIAKTVIRLGT